MPAQAECARYGFCPYTDMDGRHRIFGFCSVNGFARAARSRFSVSLSQTGQVVPQIFPKGLLAQPLALSAPVRESADTTGCGQASLPVRQSEWRQPINGAEQFYAAAPTAARADARLQALAWFSI